MEEEIKFRNWKELKELRFLQGLYRRSLRATFESPP